jgi:hypothetical protein
VAYDRGQITFAHAGTTGIPFLDEPAGTCPLDQVLVQMARWVVVDGLHDGRIPEPCGLGQSLYPMVVPVFSFALDEIGNEFVIGIVGIGTSGLH